MVAKPPGGRPRMVGDEPTPPVDTLIFLPQPAALPALSWLSTAALVAVPRLTVPPGRGTLVSGLTAAPACLAASPRRGASPPAHARLVCFVCCMMSLLFLSYVLFAPGEPATSFSRIGSRLPLSHTFHEHSRVARPPDSLLPSDATRTAIDRFLWCHPRKQNGHTRHLVATKVGAVVFATSGRNDVACGRGMDPDARGCHAVSRSPTQRHAETPTLTAAARPTEPVAAACTAGDAGVVGDARTSEPARWDGSCQPPTHHWCRHRSLRPTPRQQTHHQH